MSKQVGLHFYADGVHVGVAGPKDMLEDMQEDLGKSKSSGLYTYMGRMGADGDVEGKFIQVRWGSGSRMEVDFAVVSLRDILRRGAEDLCAGTPPPFAARCLDSQAATLEDMEQT